VLINLRRSKRKKREEEKDEPDWASINHMANTASVVGSSSGIVMTAEMGGRSRRTQRVMGGQGARMHWTCWLTHFSCSSQGGSQTGREGEEDVSLQEKRGTPKKLSTAQRWSGGQLGREQEKD
jgi:hypothetical protein